MSLYGPVELTSELAQDAIANCDFCGKPATGGYSLGWKAAWSCDKPECRKKLEEAAVDAIEQERLRHIPDAQRQGLSPCQP